MIEEWRAIPSFPGYEVSSLGRIRRMTVPRCGRKPADGLMKQFWNKRNKTGYLSLRLSVGDSRPTAKVHRLVAEAFIGTPPIGAEVNHINGDKSDNRSENLEYVNRLTNQRHAVNTGLWQAAVGEDAGSAKLTANDVLEIIDSEGIVSQTELAKSYGVTKQAIWRVLHGKSWGHLTGRNANTTCTISDSPKILG